MSLPGGVSPISSRGMLDHDSTQLSLQGFDGRTAVVTGAARGIGRRVAQTFSSLGARVAACDLESPELSGMLGIAMDVTDLASVRDAFNEIDRELGPPSLLVTSAGVFTPTPFERLDPERWGETLAINLTGTYSCVRSALPGMLTQGYGRIVTVSSVAGIDGGTHACADYAASKGAVIAFTKSISKEHCHRGVTANVVAPRNIRTRMIEGYEEELIAQTPVGRLGEPDDVAAAVAFLSSAHASYITGEVLILNGGWW
jgi:NAD(P)-dependent dehydrogenase (short-subunit alcohol dehydrogenase family)